MPRRDYQFDTHLTADEEIIFTNIAPNPIMRPWAIRLGDTLLGFVVMRVVYNPAGNYDVYDVRGACVASGVHSDTLEGWADAIYSNDTDRARRRRGTRVEWFIRDIIPNPADDMPPIDFQRVYSVYGSQRYHVYIDVPGYRTFLGHLTRSSRIIPFTAYDYASRVVGRCEDTDQLARYMLAVYERDKGRIEIPDMTVRAEENVEPRRQCRCESCKMSRFEHSKLGSTVIHEYSYEPETDWRPRRARGESPSNSLYYLGVELETDNYKFVGQNRWGKGSTEYSGISNDIAADMARPKGFWVPKHDSSVEGPEFASHPATLKWWRAHRSDLSEMFRMLLHAGYRSHDNDTCGMHVNISKSAFNDPEHLFRFMTLIHASPTWSVKMSQRTKESAENWANLEALRERARYLGHKAPRYRRGICEDAFRKDTDRQWSMPDRHIAMNLFPEDEKRFEFRLPRGTLRVDRFFKNLEWTVAMIEYTREHRLRECHPGKFMAWVMDGYEYPDLIAFIKERFDEYKETH